MVWYEELGFDDDPFDTNPLKRDDKVIGRKKVKDEVIYRIKSGSMLLIVGDQGSGKTMVLKHAIDNFKGKGKVIYIDGKKVNKRLNIEKLLIKGAGIIKGSLMKTKPKGMILLLDNVNNLTERNNKRIKYYFDQDYIRSVIFTTSDYGSMNFTDSIRDRIGKRIIKIRELPESDAVQIAKDRLEGNDILSEESMKEIYAMSGNIKRFLRNCSKVCEYALENGEEIVTKSHITEALPKTKEQDEKEEPENVCFECGEDLIQINKEWRCPECDTYCTECGAFIYEEDIRCPSCGVEFFEGDDDE